MSTLSNPTKFANINLSPTPSSSSWVSKFRHLLQADIFETVLHVELRSSLGGPLHRSLRRWRRVAAQALRLLNAEAIALGADRVVLLEATCTLVSFGDGVFKSGGESLRE